MKKQSKQLEQYCMILIKTAKIKHKSICCIKYNNAADTFKFNKHCFQIIDKKILMIWYNTKDKSTHVLKINLDIEI